MEQMEEEFVKDFKFETKRALILLCGNFASGKDILRAFYKISSRFLEIYKFSKIYFNKIIKFLSNFIY